tara:strand:- start:434 stop:799 length:366 start_codon:yes stop_codon:yes gene_type:complete
LYQERDNPLRDKSYVFALEIVKLMRELQTEEKEYVLTKQLLRSGTSIGANVEEAIGGQSEKDFFHKITIAYKEARESQYWLRLLMDVGLIEKDKGNDLLEKVAELLRIITSIQKTIKNKRN